MLTVDSEVTDKFGVNEKQDATLSQGQPRDAPYITSVLTPILPLTLSLSITYNNRH